ncbi:hypothetical protein NE237_017277 [Protea cynaroides]|uniref:Uncharacterized protein n=1 Tax=Protea cynaroides TaxID=273540 RepID=A0A9Q0QMT1_9MAGN|nr:hypothetical protein NE237_017277 [Protea cynaroides]
MGQGLSCRASDEHGLFRAVQIGDLDTVTALLERLSALHIAANGRIEVLSFLLDRSVHPDILSRHKQTPLMMATMHGKISCVQKLLRAGANILMFDSVHGRTCLHLLLLRTSGMPPSHPFNCPLTHRCWFILPSAIPATITTIHWQLLPSKVIQLW